MNPKIWTPTYVVNRVRHFLFEKRHKNLPWITPDAIKVLDGLLTKDDIGMEFGSGRSTAWYAARIKSLKSIEDHKGWYDSVKKQFEDLGLKNVDYQLKSAEGDPETCAYCTALDTMPEASLDFIVVDGKHRDILANKAVSKLRKGGILLLDDAHRYLPSKTTAPYAIREHVSKMTPLWKNFESKIQGWRHIWTSNGVTDTAIFIKK